MERAKGMDADPQQPFHEHLDAHGMGSWEERPWGGFRVLARGAGFQVKLLLVRPGECTSLQYHFHRNEFWVVLEGIAHISKGLETIVLSSNETINILKGVPHRVEAIIGGSEVHILEVQTGAILDELDIVRLHDKYGRT